MGDIVVTQAFPDRFGDAHYDHLRSLIGLDGGACWSRVDGHEVGPWNVHWRLPTEQTDENANRRIIGSERVDPTDEPFHPPSRDLNRVSCAHDPNSRASCTPKNRHSVTPATCRVGR